MMIDTHCHLQFKGLDADRDEIVATCRERGMLLNLVGTQKDTSTKAVELAMENPDMYASIGTHPNHLFPTYIVEEESSFLSREEGFDTDFYGDLYNRAPERIIAVGETGIDLYHVPDDVPVETVLEKQRDVFLQHAQFALERDLPLVIHCRDAHEQLIEVLRSLDRVKGVIHCYTSDWEHAKQYVEMGLYLGFTGVITFPPRKTDPKVQTDLLEVLTKAPMDRLLIETDAPFLAPQAYRGKRCDPWMVEETLKKIAEVRGRSVHELETIIEENTRRLFTKIAQ